MKTNEKLEAVRIALNLKQADFAKKLNIEPGTYSGLKKNPPEELSKKIIYQLENELKVRKEWLENETGGIFINEEKTTNPNINSQTIEPMIMNMDTLNRMLSIIEKQQEDIHIANLNVKKAQENQASLIRMIPGGQALGGAAAGAR